MNSSKTIPHHLLMLRTPRHHSHPTPWQHRLTHYSRCKLLPQFFLHSLPRTDLQHRQRHRHRHKDTTIRQHPARTDPPTEPKHHLCRIRLPGGAEKSRWVEPFGLWVGGGVVREGPIPLSIGLVVFLMGMGRKVATRYSASQSPPFGIRYPSYSSSSVQRWGNPIGATGYHRRDSFTMALM